MITPRSTRLVRVADLQAFREALVACSGAGAPADARDRLVVVPTRAAAVHLLRSIEDHVVAAAGGDAASPPAVLLPDMATAGELVAMLARRLDVAEHVLTDAEREVLLGVACRSAAAAGTEPPFRLRPGLIAEILHFYDELRRNQKDVDTLERLALGRLEPGASYDRGAERLVRQTRFLVAAYREFEQRCQEVGVDEHALRARLVGRAALTPYREVILAVGDRGTDPYGLWPADWDLLARIPGLEQLTLVITDTTLAGPLHERIHQVLPGIEEVRLERVGASASPVLVVPAGGAIVHTARDREDEVEGFARRVKRVAGVDTSARLDRMALVVRQPLPYVYVAREVLRSAGVPCQMFDALPLAAEPYAAAVDLVLSCVSTNFGRASAMAMLQSPHLKFGVAAGDIVSLDRALAEAGYLGEAAALERLVASWREAAATKGRLVSALRAATALTAVVAELAPLRAPAAAAEHLATLIAFLRAHEHLPGPDDPLRVRQLRARTAILGTFESLRAAYARFDAAALDFDAVAALARRWIGGQTFVPRTGDSGVHLVDAESARFGNFDHVQLAGLVEGEWPDRPRRSIFYAPSILRDLGWPAETERLDGARAAFTDLLRLPASRLVVSTFTLEADSRVTPSPFVDAVERAALAAVEEAPEALSVFEYEALAAGVTDAQTLDEGSRAWALRRTGLGDDSTRFNGTTAGHAAAAYSLSALERYQDCPFKFFAADVLRLEESPEDESALSPRGRGRFIHEVFQQFFQAWDDRGGGVVGPDRFDEARELFAATAEPLLARLPDADAALERTRLFGSAISVGIADVVLGLEAARPVPVRERWLEYRLEGTFTLGGSDGRQVPLRGVADRIDLLDGHRLRVIDYKTGSAPNPRRALQVPIYALCAQERLHDRDGAGWEIEEAAYVAFSGRRTLVPVVKAGADAAETLASARSRLFETVDGIARGEFPPRPHDPMICTWCAYATVCRKDYVDVE